MDFIKNLKDNTIIICENNFKNYILKKLAKEKIFLNVKIISKHPVITDTNVISSVLRMLSFFFFLVAGVSFRGARGYWHCTQTLLSSVFFAPHLGQNFIFYFSFS